ncbi:MAG: hypothetical protein GKR89_23730 [Candidatus Latescibacteria bacterium]|nr:hypothetical protein [Candidatus Latescibacterota bacterium]
MSEPILAGFARVDITPQADSSFEIFDPIYLRALHLRQGGRQVTLLAADLFLFDEYLAGLLATELDGTDIDPAWILPGASHLGTGPTFFQYYVNQPTEALKDFGGERPYARAAAQAVRQAREDASPAQIAVAVGPAEKGLSYNRRAHDSEGRLRMVSLTEFPEPPSYLHYGQVDPQVGVLCCRRSGRCPLALVNFGCHALALWDARGNISGDYPGRLAGLLAEAGTDSLFFQGALGNVHPVRRGDDPCGHIAASLAATVQELIEAATPAPEAALRLGARTIEVPVQPVQPVALARRHWEAQPSDREGLARYQYWLARQYQDRSRYALTLRAVALGAAALLHIPGEPFAETGRALRRAAPFEQLLVLANPCPEAGYLPTARAHGEGGDEPQFAALESEAESQIRTAALSLLDEMAG